MLRNKEETLVQEFFKANFHEEEEELTKPSCMQKWKNTRKFFIHDCCLSKYMECFYCGAWLFFGAFLKFKTKAEKSVSKIPKS